MESETLQLELPSSLMKIAEREGFTKDRIEGMMKSFVIMELTALVSKFDEKNADGMSDKVKVSAWKKTKSRLKV